MEVKGRFSGSNWSRNINFIKGINVYWSWWVRKPCPRISKAPAEFSGRYPGDVREVTIYTGESRPEMTIILSVNRPQFTGLMPRSNRWDPPPKPREFKIGVNSRSQVICGNPSHTGQFLLKSSARRLTLARWPAASSFNRARPVYTSGRSHISLQRPVARAFAGAHCI